MNEMKSTMIFLICALMMIPDSISARIDVNSSHLENKILHGQLPSQGKATYIASLQLNGVHICSSGLFREGFLLTTGSCAYHILNGMTKKNQTGTALLGDPDLSKCQRVVILDISYSRKKKIGEYDLGLVLLSDTVDYTHIEILPLYTKMINLRLDGSSASVCGYDTVSQDDIGEAQYSQHLHCMTLYLLGPLHCGLVHAPRDFKRKLICGQPLRKNQKTTLRDVGSPLIKDLGGNNGPKEYIIGVTLPLYQGRKGLLLNFVRMNYGYPFIKKMMKNLQCHEELARDNISGSSSSEDDSLDKPIKRPRVKHIPKRTVYTGNECLTNFSEQFKKNEE